MKNLFLLTFLFLTTTTIFAQNSDKWEVSLNYAYQFSMKNVADVLPINVRYNTNFYQIGIAAKRVFHQKNRFQFLGGIGVSREGADIVVGNCLPGQACPEVLRFKNNFYYLLTDLRLESKYKLTDKFNLNLEMIQSFNLYQNADASKNFYIEPSGLKFDFHTFEIYPEIEYLFNRFSISLGTRIFNLRKPDITIEHNYTFLKDNPKFFEQSVDAYNPLKLMLSVNYQF
jgi:hypothetical protein